MSFDLQPIPCDSNKWQRIRAKFAGDGIEVPEGVIGEIHQTGLTASYIWDGETLKISIDNRTNYPDFLVKHHLKDYIESA